MLGAVLDIQPPPYIFVANLWREGIIIPLDRHFVVYPGGAGVEEGASVEEVSLAYPGSSTPATP